MDIHTLGMDGVTAVKKLLNYEETKDIPVIAISADAMGQDIKRTLREGLSDYILKPIKTDDFLEKVGKV